MGELSPKGTFSRGTTPVHISYSDVSKWGTFSASSQGDLTNKDLLLPLQMRPSGLSQGDICKWQSSFYLFMGTASKGILYKRDLYSPLQGDPL